MGQPASECWEEIWHIIGPMIEAPFMGEPASESDDLILLLNRRGFLEETHFKISYSPIPDPAAQVTGIGGVLGTIAETTDQIFAERQLRTLRDLGARAAEALTSDEACRAAAATLADNTHDIPFALFYLVDADGSGMHLAASCGFEADKQAAPDFMRCDGAMLWPVGNVVRHRRPEIVPDLSARFDSLPGGHWSTPPDKAIALPLSVPDQPQPYGVLIAGISAHRELDEKYRTFFELAANHVTTAIRNANAYQEERGRAEALAEIDRAKTAFFSNVSHEFRTPLTLMLGPLEDLLSRSHTELPPAASGQLEVAHRNSLRLLRLVNTLLDFSRIEAGRMRAVFEQTDLSAFTGELASVFRAATERAGLKLVVDCPPLPNPVYVDREMWEKIVLNLISNAFKFTFEGEIAVTMRASDGGAELRIRDTGVGIPAEELPRIFERFHRVPNMRSRTYEGSGIGLALVHELVRIHGGSVRAESQLNEGTTFIVSVPFGTAHLPPEQIGGTRSLSSTSAGALPFVEEALRWLPDNGSPGEPEQLPREEWMPVPCPADGTNTCLPAILVADDNADMRRYLTRILGERYRVRTVPDGTAAFTVAREDRPDLILSDIMMPKLDGIGLLRKVRADEELRTIPVILLSARAGEEARIEGMQEGADDYLVKPFSARELLARVSAHLDMARLRKESKEAIWESGEKYRNLFESMSEGFAVHEIVCNDAGIPRDYRFLDVNPAFEKMTGLKREAVIDKRVTEVLPGTESFWIERYGRVALTGEPDRFDEYSVVLDRHFSIFAFSPGPRQFATIFSDITDRKKAELAIFEEKEKLNALIQSMPDEVWFANPEGRFTLANPAAMLEFALNGPDPLDIEKFAASLEVFRPDGSPRPIEETPPIRALNGEIVRQQEEVVQVPSTGELRVRQVNAAPVRNAAGAIIGSVSVVRDITEQKRAEEALHKANERFENVLGHLDDSFGIFDSRWRYLFLNEAAAHRLGKSRVELVGMDVRELIPGFGETPAFGQMQAVAAERKPHEWTERSPLTGRWLDWHAFPWEEGVAVFSRDVTERKKAEEALRESNAKLQAAFAGMAEAIFMADRDGRIVEFNDEFVRYHRFRDRTSCSRTTADCPECLEVWLEDGTPAILEQWAMPRALRGETATNVEYRLRRRDSGETWWGSYNFGPIRDPDGSITGAVVMARDITDQKRATLALRESEEKYRDLVEDARSIILRYDTLGRITFFNEYAEQFFGFPKNEVLGIPAVETIVPRRDSFGRDLEAMMVDLAVHPELYTINENENIKKNGDRVWIHWSNKPVFDADGSVREFLAVGTDITEHKRITEALRTSEERFRMLTQLSPVGVGVSNREGILIYTNPRYERILGYEPGELIGMKASALYANPEDRSSWLAHLDHDGVVPDVELQLMRKGGMPVWILVTVSQIPYGGEDAVMGIIQDITDRKQAEEALRENDARREFLLRLSDALRSLSSPRAIQVTATRLLADHLGASQSNYTEYSGRCGKVSCESLNDPAISLVGSYPIRDSYATWDILRSGWNLVIPDVEVFPTLSDEERAIYRAHNNRANISVPIIREGELIATLNVRQTTPREWTPAEVELVRETAERTWLAVVRAQAEEALQQKNNELVSLNEELSSAEEELRKSNVELSKNEQQVPVLH